MRITWLGHACFLLEQDGYRIVVDPYGEGCGYPPLQLQAHAVYCSHEHFDHNCRQAAELLPAGESPFRVEEVATFHDAEGGAKRGSNTVRIFTAGGTRLCHLGDLGHLLTEEQLAAVGRCDVVLVPVGGTYTLDARQAAEQIRALAPRCAVPMHYYAPPCGLKELTGVEDFLACFPETETVRLEGSSFTADGELPALLVPAFTGTQA